MKFHSSEDVQNVIDKLTQGKTVDMQGLSSWSSNEKMATSFGGKKFNAIVFHVENKSGTSIKELSSSETNRNGLPIISIDLERLYYDYRNNPNLAAVTSGQPAGRILPPENEILDYSEHAQASLAFGILAYRLYHSRAKLF